MTSVWVGQCAVAVFFAIAFVQSALDKWVNSQGNLEFLKGHFANSPLKGMVPPMFWAVTVLESIAGVLSGLGALQLLLAGGTALVLWGLVFVMLSLLCLFFGQRLAQDYAGAHVLATYFAVALLGLILLG